MDASADASSVTPHAWRWSTTTTEERSEKEQERLIDATTLCSVSSTRRRRRRVDLVHAAIGYRHRQRPCSIAISSVDFSSSSLLNSAQP